jgi:hypothetical protein
MSPHEAQVYTILLVRVPLEKQLQVLSRDPFHLEILHQVAEKLAPSA